MQTEVDATKTDNGLIFTESAAKKVKTLIEDEKNPNLKLRVFITGGGCSGFQYGFTFDEKIQDGDSEIEKCGVTLKQRRPIIYLDGKDIQEAQKKLNELGISRNNKLALIRAETENMTFPEMLKSALMSADTQI